METYFAIGTRNNVAINRYKGAVSTKYRIWQVDKHMHDYGLGAVSIRKTVLPGMAIPMLKIRRPNGRLIFNMEIAIRR